MVNNVFTIEERTYLISLDNNRTMGSMMFILLTLFSIISVWVHIIMENYILVIISLFFSMIMFVGALWALVRGRRIIKEATKEILGNNYRGEKQLKGGKKNII